VKAGVLAAAVIALACGCGSSSGSGGDGEAGTTNCMRADPTCTGTPPSYANDIAPIFTALCVSCHYAGSPYSPTSLVDYSKVQLSSGSSLGQVEACLMPPPGTPQLTEAQRTAVLSWLACGAPDN
jgi:hypothetical protein